jgi:rubrerythrin
MQIFSPKKYDLFNKTLREEFQSAASLIKSSKGDLKSREVQVSCMDSLNKTIENLKKEQEKYTSTTFSKVFEHSKAKDFFLSVKNNDVLKVRRLLRTYPSLVDVVNSVSPKQTQQNALHWAGQRSSAEMIESLLQAGVDWRHQDLLGRDPMKVAAKWKNPEVLQIFQTKKTEALIWAKKKTMKHVLRFNTILRSSTLKGKKF